jgi:hypothetical protein
MKSNIETGVNRWKEGGVLREKEGKENGSQNEQAIRLCNAKTGKPNKSRFETRQPVSNNDANQPVCGVIKQQKPDKPKMRKSDFRYVMIA